MTVLPQTALTTDTKVSDLNEYRGRVILFHLEGGHVGSEGLLPSQLDGSRRGALEGKLGRWEGEHQHVIRLQVKVSRSSAVQVLQTCTDLKGEGGGEKQC